MLMAFALVFLVLFTILFSFFSPWWFTPLASNWGSIDLTLIITFVITGIVFTAVMLFTAYVVFKYRHRDGLKADYEPENKKIEAWLTGVTGIAIAIMLAPGLIVWADYIKVPDNAVEFEAIGQQWSWTFRLPGEDGEFGEVDHLQISYDNPFGLKLDDPAGRDDLIIEDSEVHLLLDQPVKAMLRSVDVLHDFFVPQFRAKMDLVPGISTYFWLTPTRTGTFEILCAELCGIGHSDMRGLVTVATQEDYDAWLAGLPIFGETEIVQKYDAEAKVTAMMALETPSKKQADPEAH
jgi:cytochrome c oxidase subunit 2